jgi:hypothetical protein
MTRCPCCQQERPLPALREGQHVCAGCSVPETRMMRDLVGLVAAIAVTYRSGLSHSNIHLT